MILSLAAVTSALTGCVERRLEITSEPAGAMVFLADEPIGRTPLTVPFTWYGDYEVILRLDNHQALQTHAQINAPWYDIPPWDLVSQAMVPWTYHYNVTRHYQLEPLTQPTDRQLIDRATQLQQRNLEPVEK